MTVDSRRPGGLEHTIARLLTIGTYVSVTLLAVGTILFLASGASPLDPAPALDVRNLPADVLALRPAGLVWLGLLAVIATPSARVVTALVAFARGGERRMTFVSVFILAVIVLSVAVALVTEPA